MIQRALIGFLTGLILAACTSQLPTPSPAELRSLAAQTLEAQAPRLDKPVSFHASANQNPSGPAGSPTPTPGEAGIPAPDGFGSGYNIATQIARPESSNPEARISGLSILDTGGLLISVEIAHPPSSTFSAELGSVILECTSLPEHPNRVYCYAPAPAADGMRVFTLFQDGLPEPVISAGLWVPALPAPGDAAPTLEDTPPSANTSSPTAVGLTPGQAP